MKKNKDLLLIFIFLALISFSDGIFYNFQELWMVDNAFSLKTISIVFSLCSLITVSTIFLCSNLIRKENLKKFILVLVFLKVFLIMALFVLNMTGLKFFLKLFIMFDFVIDIEILTSIYPMMSLIKMSNKDYAKKDLIYNGAFYLGVILTIFLLGKNIGVFQINYNSYLFFALIADTIAFGILYYLDLNKYIKKDKPKKLDKLIIEELWHDIKDDKISKLYFKTIIANQMSYNTAFGLIITMLTGLSFSPSKASGLAMILGISSVLIGSLVLAKLTFKNNYINIAIKLGLRFILCFIAAIFGSRILFIMAYAYAKLLSTSYSHVFEAPYINRIGVDFQLAFCNLKEMVTYFGRAISMYLCGFLLNIDLHLNFLVAGIFCVLEIYYRCKSYKFLAKEGGIT